MDFKCSTLFCQLVFILWQINQNTYENYTYILNSKTSNKFAEVNEFFSHVQKLV